MKMIVRFSVQPILFFIAFINWFANAHAQVKGVLVSPSVFNFGEVHNWKNPPALFTVTNRSSEPLVFLPLFPKPDILVELPVEPISVGESAVIKVFYYTSQPGSFDKTAQVYVNISDQPLVLKIEGDILSFNPDALITCPGFAPKTFGEAQSFVQEIKVIDQLTRQPVQDAAIRMLGNNQEYMGATDRNGMFRNKIMLGLHDILITKPGYLHELRIFYLNRNTGLLTVEMKRDTAYEEPAVALTDELPKEELEKLNSMPEDTVAVNTIPANIQPEKPVLLSNEKYNPNNIVFLIDASSSMKGADKLPLLKNSMKNLLSVLRGIDKFSMVTYAATAKVIVSGIPSDNKNRLEMCIDTLKAFGYTNGVKGIETAYALAEKNYVFGGNNQIILATDGLFNNPGYDETALMNLVKKQASYGIKLSVVAFGNDAKAHRLMKKLAANGQGNFIHITPENEANAALTEEIKIHSAKK